MATSRRDLLKIGGLATASLLVSQKSFAAWAPSERYPDPRIVAVDDSFRRYMLASAKVERIASGFRTRPGTDFALRKAFQNARLCIFYGIC